MRDGEAGVPDVLVFGADFGIAAGGSTRRVHAAALDPDSGWREGLQSPQKFTETD